MRLELRGVTAKYGDTIALRDVSLVVPSGGVVAILGPNGAGKSTMLSVAAGLVPPARGSVLVDREDVTGERFDRVAKRGICYVPEGRSIFASLTVRESLRLYAGRGEEGDVVERAVSAFPRLGQRLNQTAGTMSGGEQQMLALARAYGGDARLVMVDEVSMGLAPILVDEIFGFFGRLRDEGVTLLIVEQYVTRALGLADTIYLLSRGRVVFAGEPGEIGGTDLFESYLTGNVEEAAPV